MLPVPAQRSLVTRKVKKTEEETNRKEFALSLAVCGSPAPRCPQQTKVSKSSRSCKQPKKEKKHQEFCLPMDKIILLTERLELSTLREQKVECVSLWGMDLEGRSYEEEGNGLVTRCEKLVEEEEEEEMARRSPAFNFPLDLSSVSQLEEESEESCNEIDVALDERSLSVIRKNFIPTTSETEKSPSRFLKTSPMPSERTALPQKGETKKKQQGNDLINLYINAVENSDDLTKYFRPCHECLESSCICSESRSHSRVLSADTMKRCEDRSPGISRRRVRDSVESWGSGKTNKAVETDINVTGFKCKDCPLAGERCFHNYSPCGVCHECEPDSFSSIEAEAVCLRDCFCRCTMDDHFQGLDETSLAGDSMRVSSYASSLASAARSARVLARELEVILSNFKADSV